MNLLIQTRVRICLVSATLLAAWGCEDDGNLGFTDARTDAANGAQSDQPGPAPEVPPDGPPEASVSLPDALPDIPASMDMDTVAPDAAMDSPIDTPDAADAGPEAPPSDDARDGAPDSESDTPPEGPPDAGGNASCPGASCPLAIAPGHLQLWLQGDDDVPGDQEIDCPFNGTVGRVREWRDRSGKGNHAKPASGQVGPLCGVSAGMLNGKRVVTFPRTMGQEDGEHLEVSLASIQDRPFTVVIVEKRPDVVDSSSWMLGGSVENPYDACVPDMPGVNAGRVLQVGYGRRWQRRASTWGPSCGVISDGTPATAAGMPDPKAPNATSMWMVTLNTGKKLTLYVNGKSAEAEGEGLGSKGTLAPITGFIGRGSQPLISDSRFKGDIAEILIFDVALDDDQRRTLEQHLQPRWGFAITN